jgi:hypothetical protein
MRRSFALTFLICFAATTGLAQSRLNGKWVTDRPPDPQLVTNAERRQSVELELTVDGAKASGTLNLGGLGGNFYILSDGKVSGNTIQFRMSVSGTWSTWTIELVDDKTVTLNRGPLELVGNNALDLLPLLRRLDPLPPAVQSATTSISGSVYDKSGAIILGVKVTAILGDTGVELATMTNDTGSYAFASLPPGKYTLSASLSGFDTATVNNLTMGATPIQQDITLEVRKSSSSTNPPAASCSRNGMMWCVVLHRAK